MGGLKKKDEVTVADRTYTVLRLLGHGKECLSYLVTDGEMLYTLKDIKSGRIDLSDSADAVGNDIRGYERLNSLGIRVPKLYAYDKEKEYLVKEYIPGPSINMLVMNGNMKDSYYNQVRGMSKLLSKNNLNIDYFPTNFIVNEETLYYVDYECDKYNEAKNFDNWGAKFWYMTDDFAKEFMFLNNHSQV